MLTESKYTAVEQPLARRGPFFGKKDQFININSHLSATRDYSKYLQVMNGRGILPVAV